MDTEEILITLVLAALIAGAIFFAARSQPADKSASASACPSDKSGKSSGKSGKSPGKSGKNSFQTIPDNYTTISQVSAALRKAGLESSELIVGIDFTKSNEWTGEQCFGGRSLHHIDPAGATLNPYQVAIRTVSHALEAFDDDGLIPAYGFGCSKTKDRAVFSLTADESPCAGFAAVLEAYDNVTPTLKLSGPTSFAPLIRKAIELVQTAGGFHVLLIVADGQVTSEAATIQAIVEASAHPLAIVLVGVGDGPWDTMREFDDGLPERMFDNFQFVPYEEIKGSCASPEQFEAKLALACLMEIPEQFQYCRQLGLFVEPTQCSATSKSYKMPAAPEAAPGANKSQKESSNKGFDKAASTEAPENYTCPITHELMDDPVVSADGYTYERDAIEGWFRNKNTSPMNNQRVDPGLIPNNALRSQIMEWKEHNKRK